MAHTQLGSSTLTGARLLPPSILPCLLELRYILAVVLNTLLLGFHE